MCWRGIIAPRRVSVGKHNLRCENTRKSFNSVRSCTPVLKQISCWRLNLKSIPATQSVPNDISHMQDWCDFKAFDVIYWAEASLQRPFIESLVNPSQRFVSGADTSHIIGSFEKPFGFLAERFIARFGQSVQLVGRRNDGNSLLNRLKSHRNSLFSLQTSSGESTRKLGCAIVS